MSDAARSASAPVKLQTKAHFNWEDPLDLESQLTEEDLAFGPKFGDRRFGGPITKPVFYALRKRLGTLGWRRRAFTAGHQ